MFNGFGVQRQQVFSMTALPQRWRPRLRLEKGGGAGIQSFKYILFKIYPIRIIGPSNGRVNEPVFRRGVLCSQEWPLLFL